MISRTDSIGDVVLTLPMAGVLKKQYPHSFIYFLGQKYTQPIVNCSEFIDHFIDWSEIKKMPFKDQVSYFRKLSIDQIIHVFPNQDIAKIAKKAGIPERIGTRNRWFHWIYCNRRIKLSRRKSNLHEAQLNIRLLPQFTHQAPYPIEDIFTLYGIEKIKPIDNQWQNYIVSDKINLILHPKSKGSAREWSLNNYARLIELLPQNRYNILLTGTEEEGELFRESLALPYPFLHDLSGKLSLTALIELINSADALVACSTGPLHIAAALGKIAIGIYPPIKPMHPQRWAPIGKNAHVIVIDKECELCRKSKNCECISSIKPEQIVSTLESLTFSNKKIKTK